MAPALSIQCPECGTELPITMRLRASVRRGDALVVDVEPDLVDAMAHTWTHDDGLAGG